MKIKWPHIFCGVLMFSSTLFARPLDLPREVWESSDLLFNYWGVKKSLAKHGIYFLSTYLMDLDWPTTGGIQTPSYPLFLYVYNLELGIDFEQLIHFKGGNFYSSFVVHGGKRPSLDFIGDAMGIDNIEAYNLVQLAELWYQQVFFAPKLAITVGKIDIYPSIPYTHYAQVLLNNSYSQPPTIIGYPSYPNPAVGILFEADVRDWLTLKVSIFDGSNAQGVRTGNLGAKPFFQNLGRHILFLNQVEFMWRAKKEFHKGRLTLGFWGFNGRISTLNNEEMGKTAGPFIGASQSFWREKPKKDEMAKRFQPGDLGGFVQWGYVNPQISAISQYVSGGLTYQNAIKGFDSDAISIGVVTAFFSKATGSPFIKSYEMSLEATYQMNVLPGITIQPDIQWVINPGGNGNANALVVLLRMSISI
jgi:porin